LVYEEYYYNCRNTFFSFTLMQHKPGPILFLAQAGFCLGLDILLEFQARNFSPSCPAYLFSGLAPESWQYILHMHFYSSSRSFFHSGS